MARVLRVSGWAERYFNQPLMDAVVFSCHGNDGQTGAVQSVSPAYVFPLVSLTLPLGVSSLPFFSQMR